jgi:predicted nucleotidyltransferase
MRQPYKEVMGKLLESLKKHFSLVSLVVYGSVARGKSEKGCDMIFS